jgi:8-oxo-dGTP pyrophosphatase MutT (NUDIX family)
MQLPSLEEINKIRKSGYRPQVVGCFLNNKKILFLYKNKYKIWQLPQGGIDNRESIKEAIVREMTEELGENFTASIKAYSLFGHDKIKFPVESMNSRNLKTDQGKKITMKGKKYFFIKIDYSNFDLNIKETEFDDFKYLNYEEAINLSKKIYQPGKRRITINILKSLRNLGFL